MATKDYKSVSLPIGLILRIDEFLESEEAKRIGVSSRSQVLTMLMRNFLEKWDTEKGSK